MKHEAIGVLLSALILLSACAPLSTAEPISTPTVTPVPPTPAPSRTPTATETPRFTIDSLDLSSRLTTALKGYMGLESSIILQPDGTFTAKATFLSAQSEPVTESLEVDPSTIALNVENRNKYGRTPLMVTADGLKVYWIQEHRGWYAVGLSADINKPVFVPFDQRKVATRVIITEFSEPFSQEAVEHWKTAPGLGMGFQFLNVNAITGENTKFGYLTNFALGSEISAENSPLQILDAWFSTSLPDGTVFQFFPTKWFDPTDPRDPNPNEWKIIFAASGQEIMGNEENRAKFNDLLTMAAGPGARMSVVPIFKVQPGFFNNTNNLITFGTAQPSLEKLLDAEGNNMADLPNPGHDDNPYRFTFDYHFPNLTADNPAFVVGISQDDPKYHGFFPQEIQTIILPSMIILR